jgi:methionyl-tRNA formyltransferase
MSITLYLLNKKGFNVLTSLVKSENYIQKIDVVIGAKDKGNEEDCYEEIRSLCIKNNIKFIDRSHKYTIQSEYGIAIGWRWLINNQKNLIVLHDSLLPKYRGFSPVVNMLINGESYLGATAIYANEKMDEGDILFQQKIKINYPLKIYKAIEIIADLYVIIVNDCFKYILNKQKLPKIPQCENEASYSIWRNEEDYFIDWTMDAAEIVRFVNAVGYPYGGARTKTNDGETIKILECEKVNIKSEINAPGKLLMFEEKYPIILCGQNAVKLLKVENMNKIPYTFKKFRIRFK